MAQPQNSRFYLPFLLVLMGILPSSGCSGDASDEAEHSDSFIYVAQERQDRVWIQRAFQEVPLRHPVHEALLQPVILKLYAGELYIYDFGSMQLKRFARDGRLLNTIGAGHGQGPGEFVRIVDFYAKDGRIRVLDGRAWTLSQFDIDGTFISRSVVDGHMFRITQAGDHFITMTLMSGDLFYIVDSTGQRLKGFGGFLLDEVRNALALDGNFADHDGEDMLYVPLNASFLYYYNPATERERVVQTIDRLPYTGDAAMQPEGSGNVIRAPTWRTRVSAQSVDGDVLYLHVSFPDSENEGSRVAVLDRYDARSGEYISSTRLPFRAVNAVVHGGRVYALGDTTVTIWEFGG